MLTCGTSGKGGHLAAGELLQVIAQPTALVAVLELLQADRRRADPAARHDQRVVRQLVQVDEGHRAALLGRLQRLQQPVVRVTAPAGAQDGAAPGQGVQGGRVERPAHAGDAISG
jgi:hypothetical protein